MDNNKKEQERAELHRTIWNMANDLRGSVDGWDFKQYVLGMLFYRYISENITVYINAGEWEVGNKNLDYTKLSDNEAEQAREDLVKTKDFFILPSELFENVRAFIMHSLSWLATNGTAAIVCFPGVMYRGGAEKKFVNI